MRFKIVGHDLLFGTNLHLLFGTNLDLLFGKHGHTFMQIWRDEMTYFWVQICTVFLNDYLKTRTH